MLLRGFAKLVAAVVVAGIGGLAIGTALAALSGDDDTSTSAPDDRPGASAQVPTATTRSDNNAASGRPKEPAKDVRVRVVSATLRQAQAPAARSRQRARVSVQVRVTNRDSLRVSIPRPVLVSEDARVMTDPNADSPATNLRALDPGATRKVTLRFEIAGAVTKRVLQKRRVRLIVAGRRVSAPLTSGEAGGSQDATPQPPAAPASPPAAPPAAPDSGATG